MTTISEQAEMRLRSCDMWAWPSWDSWRVPSWFQDLTTFIINWSKCSYFVFCRIFTASDEHSSGFNRKHQQLHHD